MPHDRKGNLIKVGDLVNVPCVVKSVNPGDEYCNCTVETSELMPPYIDQSGRSTVTLNTKQVEKILPVEESEK